MLTFIFKKILHVFFCIGASFLIMIICSEIYLICYMRNNGIIDRLELSEDYGFGMVVFLGGGVIFILSFMTLIFLTKNIRFFSTRKGACNE